MGKKVSAIGIKQLWHTAALTTDLTASALAAIVGTQDKTTGLFSGGSGTAIENVHQDTWEITEEEPSQETYKNQLTGTVYRMGEKEMGEVAFNFTIGRYDYALKQALMGGNVSASGNAWKRQRGVVHIEKAIIALTEDDQFCVLSRANVNTNEGNTDGAVGLAVKATALEPDETAVSPEYWFDAEELTNSSFSWDKVTG